MPQNDILTSPELSYYRKIYDEEPVLKPHNLPVLKHNFKPGRESKVLKLIISENFWLEIS